MTEHTQWEYTVQFGVGKIREVGKPQSPPLASTDTEETAQYIVKSCNAYPKLVEALKLTLARMNELYDSWVEATDAANDIETVYLTKEVREQAEQVLFELDKEA